MITECTIDKFVSLFENESFLSACESAESKEDFRKLLFEKGLEISDADIDQLLNLMPSQEGELSENNLVEVTGGTARGFIPISKFWRKPITLFEAMGSPSKMADYLKQKLKGK